MELSSTSWIRKAGSTMKFVALLSIHPDHVFKFTMNVKRKRWGDAPVHSIAAALFASRSQIHFFDDIGYEHSPYTHCPKDVEKWKKGKCGCSPERSFGVYLFPDRPVTLRVDGFAQTTTAIHASASGIACRGSRRQISSAGACALNHTHVEYIVQ
jgi:hypothetical protein